MMTAEQFSRWEDALKGLRAAAADGGDDPWLFHGTNQENAQTILCNGFDPNTSWVSTRESSGGPGGATPCVFWTDDVAMAEKFALNKSCYLNGGFPVILMAHLSDVTASGTPVPDRNTWSCDYDEDPEMEPKSWRDSLERLRAIAVLDGRHVNNLRVVSVGPLEEKPDPTVFLANFEATLTTAPIPTIPDDALEVWRKRLRERRGKSRVILTEDFDEHEQANTPAPR